MARPRSDTGVEGYPNGSFARGAPANAGGGGTDGNPSANDQNSGGGGGANGGAGGQGGNTWSSNLAVGGAGGVAVPAPSVTKVVLGGGGGGATRNNAGPSSGGVGAGLVILDVGSLPGTGEIRANGGDGQTAANDGGGGGGAGGSVVVAAASGGLSGLTVSANGGDGGDAWPTQAPGGFPGERHGPGGGGGGGFVLLSTSGATTTTNGGAHGVTTTASDAYNATDGTGGSAGTFVGLAPRRRQRVGLLASADGDEADVDAFRHEHARGHDGHVHDRRGERPGERHGPTGCAVGRPSDRVHLRLHRSRDPRRWRHTGRRGGSDGRSRRTQLE